MMSSRRQEANNVASDRDPESADSYGTTDHEEDSSSDAGAEAAGSGDPADSSDKGDEGGGGSDGSSGYDHGNMGNICIMVRTESPASLLVLYYAAGIMP